MLNGCFVLLCVGRHMGGGDKQHAWLGLMNGTWHWFALDSVLHNTCFRKYACIAEDGTVNAIAACLC